jgi:ribose 5-phosphate isomerase B
MTVRRFTLIAESDARQIEPGSTVELDAGGHVTPLAQDTLRERRVTVVRAGALDASLPADLAPAAEIRRVAIGSDETGAALKAVLIARLRATGRQVADVGPAEAGPAEYPDIAAAVARAVARGEADAGLVIDATGVGSAVAANKVRGIRAAMCPTVTLARQARAQYGTNVLTLGSTIVDASQAADIVDTWLSTPTQDARDLRQLLKIRTLEERF